MDDKADSVVTQARKRRWPVVVFLFLAVLIGVATFIYFRPAAPENTPPEISFVRFETLTGGGVEGVFTVYNPHNRPIQFFPSHPEVQKDGLWPFRPVAINRFTSGFYSMEVRSHERVEIQLPGPGNAAQWRVPIWWEFGMSATEKLKLMLSQNWSAYWKGQPLPGRQVSSTRPVQFSVTFSPVVTNSVVFGASAESNARSSLGEIDLLGE